MQLDSQACEQGDVFEALNESMKQLTISFANEKLSFDQIALHMNDVNNTTKEHIRLEFSRLKQETAQEKHQAAQEKYRTEVLASLHFPEIKSRQEEIKDAHKQTFQWIFDQSGRKIRPWSNFVNWLEEGSGFYWINGKAGSGKSTLMNYVQEDSRTIEALRKWAGSKNLIVPVFFFWAAGSDLQKSLCGLLRSLIYQLLKEEPGLTYSAAEHEEIGLFLKEQALHIAWTEKKLRWLFSSLCYEISSSCRVCLFIDGLDEFAGDHHALIDLLEEVVENIQVKCCLSSRPERPFTRFENSAMLKLQDLTRGDISGFVHATLSKSTQNKQFISETTDLIVWKANGVFLWAELAVRSQVNGIRNGDNEGTLQKRLESLPLEIDGLYSDMLSRIETVYHEEASRYIYLTMVLESQGKSSVFNYSLVIFALDDEKHLKSLRTDPKAIIARCSSIKQRIDTICGGFLEVHKEQKLDYDFDSYSEFETDYTFEHGTHSDRFLWEPKESILSAASLDWSSMAVKFCHRTARDFFMANSKGKSFASIHRRSTNDRRCLSAAIKLAKISLCELEDPKYYISKMIAEIMKDALNSEEENSHMPMGFIDHVDQVMAALDLSFNGSGLRDHWCNRWCYDGGFKFAFRGITSDETLSTNLSAMRSTWYQKSFLDVATLLGLYKYAQMKLKERQSDISAEEISQLMHCTTIQHKHGWDKSSASKEALAFILQLVNPGACPGLRPLEMLWKLVLLWLFENVVLKASVEPGVTEAFRNVIKAFVDCGVDPFPKLTISQPVPVRIKSSKRGETWKALFEINPAVVPFMYALLKDEYGSTWMNSLEESRQSPERSKDKELRLNTFVFDTNEMAYSVKSWYGPIVVMTDEQVQSLHKVIQTLWTTHLSDSREAAKLQLSKSLWSINDYHNRRILGDGTREYEARYLSSEYW